MDLRAQPRSKQEALGESYVCEQWGPSSVASSQKARIWRPLHFPEGGSRAAIRLILRVLTRVLIPVITTVIIKLRMSSTIRALIRVTIRGIKKIIVGAIAGKIRAINYDKGCAIISF